MIYLDMNSGYVKVFSSLYVYPFWQSSKHHFVIGCTEQTIFEAIHPTTDCGETVKLKNVLEVILLISGLNEDYYLVAVPVESPITNHQK